MMPEVWLDRLIMRIKTYHQVRSLNYQLKVARFTIHWDFLVSIGMKPLYSSPKLNS